jgi:hypothetical protein
MTTLSVTMTIKFDYTLQPESLMEEFACDSIREAVEEVRRQMTRNPTDFLGGEEQVTVTFEGNHGNQI